MISPRPLPPLRLGADVVRRLLPHRPPLLLVDAIEGFDPAVPALQAVKLMSASDPVFAGHFPEVWLWPGAYTIEGLAQTCALIGALVHTEQVLRAAGRGSVAELLTRLEHSITHFAAPPSADDTALLAQAAATGPGLLAAVNVKLLHPVFAGSTLVYRAERTHVASPLLRFDVEATVDSRAVARGTLTVATR